MNKRKTMGDIARQAGVSRSTVSRVLNGEPVVSAETASAVRRLAAEMGYRMRPSRKRGERSSTQVKRVLVVSNEPIEIGTGLAAMGNALLGGLSELAFMPEFEDWGNLTAARVNGISGVVLLRSEHGAQLPECLKGIACVQLLELPNAASLHLDAVSMDYHMVGLLAADWLHSRGCKRLVSVMPTNQVAQIRERAFEERARMHGCDVVFVRAPGDAVRTEDAQRLVDEITGMDPALDGLFVFNDLSLLVLYSHLVKQGLDSDHGLEMIGCDAKPFIRALSPRPATIDVHIAEIAKRTAETLMWRIDNPLARPVTVMIRPEIVEP